MLKSPYVTFLLLAEHSSIASSSHLNIRVLLSLSKLLQPNCKPRIIFSASHFSSMFACYITVHVSSYSAVFLLFERYLEKQAVMCL